MKRTCLRYNLLTASLALFPLTVFGQGYRPSEAAEKMTLAKGFSVRLVASEPQVRQPILVKIDDRGRLWTIQYLQYPNPAGLKRVKVDRWSRTVYDRVPKPPPLGPKGADRVTILADTDGDGRADIVKDFVTGLNLATGLEFGDRGVYVLQVPYLLFYPDRDRNDVPDAPPKVLLSGFGMEDAQSLVNHLTWGPDGWLYGVNGSTTTCRVRGIEFQQGVWRYHPATDRFELFCEGGGNTFGLTFDDVGNLFYSTNGGPFIHALQSAYYRKSFGKHGPLHNPHAYGFFEVVDRDKVPGGPPTGGTIYLGDSFPDQFRGHFIAGNFLGHTASWWRLTRHQATFKARLGGTLLNSHDTWFGPTDMCLAPDGSMYVSDFHDKRTAHPDPDANWDRSNGRIYNIQYGRTQRPSTVDLAKTSSSELVTLLTHKNRWFAQRARVELAYRRDKSTYPRLRRMLQSGDHATVLQALWALNVSGGLTDQILKELLGHISPYVRSWAVRLIGDQQHPSRELTTQLMDLALDEDTAVVRSQLACTAKRIAGTDGIGIALSVLIRQTAQQDDRLKWLIWWALESKSISHANALVQFFRKPLDAATLFQARLVARRWAAEGTEASYSWLAQVLSVQEANSKKILLTEVALGLSQRARGIGGIGQGGLFEGFAQVQDGQQKRNKRAVTPVTGPLRDIVLAAWREDPSNSLNIELALLCGHKPAYRRLLAAVGDRKATVAELKLLRRFADSDCVEPLMGIVAAARPDTGPLAIAILGKFSSAENDHRLLRRYPSMTASMRGAVRRSLFSNPQSSLRILSWLRENPSFTKQVEPSELRIIRIHSDPALDKLVDSLWGKVNAGTPEEKLATMRRFNNDLRAGSGNPTRGKTVFQKTCATCHRLRNEGTRLGPDLTDANRLDRSALLANIVDPNSVIRREYLSYIVTTKDGRVLTGLLIDQDEASVTLADAKNRKSKVSRADIEAIRESDTSLMPEKLLEPLTPQQLRDLFSYLQK